jgi:hypothetical protein
LYPNWGFFITEEEGEELFKLIPDDTEILITHSPPHDIMDTVEEEKK